MTVSYTHLSENSFSVRTAEREHTYKINCAAERNKKDDIQ